MSKKEETPKPPEQKQEPYEVKAGDYVYAAACGKCGEAVVLAGPVPEGQEITFTGPGSMAPKSCSHCGHVNRFKPHEIRKAQAKPKH